MGVAACTSTDSQNVAHEEAELSYVDALLHIHIIKLFYMCSNLGLMYKAGLTQMTVTLTNH